MPSIKRLFVSSSMRSIKRCCVSSSMPSIKRLFVSSSMRSIKRCIKRCCVSSSMPSIKRLFVSSSMRSIKRCIKRCCVSSSMPSIKRCIKRCFAYCWEFCSTNAYLLCVCILFHNASHAIGLLTYSVHLTSFSPPSLLNHQNVPFMSTIHGIITRQLWPDITGLCFLLDAKRLPLPKGSFPQIYFDGGSLTQSNKVGI